MVRPIHRVASAALTSAMLFALSVGAANAQIAGTQGASAQPVTRAAIGSFVRDQSGAVIGSLKDVSGDTATVWIGFVNTPGNHLITVPLSQLATSGGRVVLNAAAATAYARR